MLTFIVSVILVSIICLCFYKKDFWEHRYIVLLISGCAALAATLIVNFSSRGNLETKTEVSMVESMKTFYVRPDVYTSAVKQDSLNGPRLSIVRNYNWYGDHNAKEFYKDTTKKQVPATLILFSFGKKNDNRQVGIMNGHGHQDYFNINAIYFVKSTSDSIAYVSKKVLYYDTKPNSWITGFSLPRKSSITILHVPPTEFAMIPDSLVRPLPY